MADEGLGDAPSEGEVAEGLTGGEGFDDLAFSVGEGDRVDLQEDVFEVEEVFWGRVGGFEGDGVNVVEGWFFLWS